MRCPARHFRIAAMTLALALAATAALAQVHSEAPALTRPFTTESFSTQPDDLRARLQDRGFTLEASGLALSEEETCECHHSHSHLAGLDAGFRAALALRYGRYALTAEGTEDGRRNLDAREYPARVAAGAVWPEARLAGALVAGFDQDGYAGTDLALEGAPLPVRVPTAGVFPADFRPDLLAWARLRFPSGGGDPVLSPALALALQHLPVLASRLVLAPSLQGDYRSGAAPVTALVLQAVYAADSHPLGGGGGAGGVIRRDSPRPSHLLANLFLFGGFSWPLDDRSRGRLALGLGTDLDRVGGGPWPTSR